MGLLEFVAYWNISFGEVIVLKIMKSYYETIVRSSLSGAEVSLSRHILHPAFAQA